MLLFLSVFVDELENPGADSHFHWLFIREQVAIGAWLVTIPGLSVATSDWLLVAANRAADPAILLGAGISLLSL